MRIGLVDVDGHNDFPNIALMKLSAYHKSIGDSVEWHDPCGGGHYDKVYMSKVFSFSKDYDKPIDADEVIHGGSGYCIDVVDGKECWNRSDVLLPYEIEHQYPDYGLYGITDTAYGFLSRGCPRGCDFCHVKSKEGRKSYKVADLREFWDGQKYIEEMSPNMFACPEWEDLAGQLVESKAYVNLNQGVDVRMLTPEKIEYIKRMKLKMIHIAWDRPEDEKLIVPKMQMLKDLTGWGRQRCTVYILINFNSSYEEDIHRVMECRRVGFDPYIMVYRKDDLPRWCWQKKLQRWCNWKPFWGSFNTFREYWETQYREPYPFKE